MIEDSERLKTPVDRWLAGGPQLSEAEMREEVERIRTLKLGWLPAFAPYGVVKCLLPDVDQYEPVFRNGSLIGYWPANPASERQCPSAASTATATAV